jgi:hypothetical protein
MNSWNFMTKSVERKDKDILNKYINKEKKDAVLILGSPINMKGRNPDYAPSTQIVDRVLNTDRQLLNKFPTNKAFASQGGSKPKTGSALYNKNSNIIMNGGGAYRMRETTKRFLKGGDMYDMKNFNAPEKGTAGFDIGSTLGKAFKYLFWDLPKMFGGAELTAQQKAYVEMVKKQQKVKPNSSAKMDLKEEQMLEQKLNPLDKKEVARRKQLSGLTDKQKKAYLRMQNKKGVENYNKQVAEYAKQGEIDKRYNEEREWRNTQKSDRQEDLDYKAMLKRQAEEKAKEEADKEWYDKLGDYALEKGLPELTKLIPVKGLQKPAEQLLKIGVDKLRGNGDIRPATSWNKKVKEHMTKNSMTLREASKALASSGTSGNRKPSAWNERVKEYMKNNNSTLKEALLALKK